MEQINQVPLRTLVLRITLRFALILGVILFLTLLLPPAGLGVEGVFWAELISQLTGATACFLTMRHVIWKEMDRRAAGA